MACTEIAERTTVRTSHPLHFATVGSVDDGKSTLIGRLLHDSKSIFEDQLEHISAVSKRRGNDYVDLALLTDGLRAEREQGITIDVAYRYFSTPHRDFVIADCPGHVQYTRNMITGVSRAELAIVLVDARHGIVEQTRRHSLLASLLRVPHLVIGVNKMDLVDHSEERFDEIVAEFTAFAQDLELQDVTFIPISALVGDNVVERSTNMDWYSGPTLLHHLETVAVAAAPSDIGIRFPVQYVIRPHRAEYRDYRGYAGTLAAGMLRPGDDVVILPAGVRTTVASIDTADGPIEHAEPGRAVTVVLADDVDVSRGDLVATPDDQPIAIREVTAVLHRLDVEELGTPRDADTLALNEIGLVSLKLTEPIFADDYRRNRSTGSFVLIDEATHQTVAAGMIRL
jgi:bifunctional enzyme CysN/CysC